MGGWAAFWGILLAVTLVLYAVLVVYVTIGGFQDIKQMFATLAKKNDDDDESA